MVFRPLLALLVSLAAAGLAKGDAPLYVEGGTLIDGSGNPPRPNPGIFLSNGVIESVGGTPPAGVESLSAEGQWILPGMFDLHAHITFKLAGARDLEDDVVNAVRSERFLEAYQRIGVTTVRDVASRYHVGYSLKRAQRDGLAGGARFYVSGPLITTTAGHATEFQPLEPPVFAVEADGPWEFRKRVREAVKLGVDLIKLTPPYTHEELAAVVDEAHYWKLRVTAHVGGAQDLHQVSGRLAVEAGVDSVEHLYPYGGPEVVKELARKGIYVIPTMGYHLRELAGEYTYKADWLEANLGHTREGMMELLRQMRESGVKFGVGTDSNAKDLETIGALYLQELEGLLEGGLTPMQVVQSATLHAAEAMGLGGEAGSITPGKRADVILVRQDPLVDLGALVRPRLVIQNGEIVHRSDALEGSWTLEGYELQGKEVPVSGTMIFESGYFGLVYRMGSASDAGRGHGGRYRVEGDRLLFAIPYWSEFVDGKPNVIQSPVEAGGRFEIQGDRLAIHFDSGSVQRLKRLPAGPAGLADGAWRMTSYESRAKTGAAEGLALFQGGRFALVYNMRNESGALDGRAHGGAFTIASDSLSLEVKASIHCVGGKGLVEAEDSRRETKFRREGNRLTVELGGGATMTFAREES
jgi:imidazolonepropionase-like amidohydrolase